MSFVTSERCTHACLKMGHDRISPLFSPTVNPSPTPITQEGSTAKHCTMSNREMAEIMSDNSKFHYLEASIAFIYRA
jgi:hypothetical protein